MRRPWSARLVVLALAGIGLLVAGVLVPPQDFPLGPTLLAVGGVVLLGGVAFPLVSRLTLGIPTSGGITRETTRRATRMRMAAGDVRPVIEGCATSLCPDPDAALRAVVGSLSDGMAGWRRADTVGLRTYLLCLLVQQARAEVAGAGPPAVGANGFHALPQLEREVLVLLERAGLDAVTVGELLHVPVHEIGRIRSRAHDVLASIPRGRA